MSRLIACLLLMFASITHSEEPVLKLSGIDGHNHAPLETGDKQASLLFFVHTFSHGTAASMDNINKIAADYADRVAVYLVHSARGAARSSVQIHALRHNVKAPVLLDTRQRLARKVQASMAPEAVVIGRDGTVLYKGRIDDSLSHDAHWEPPTTSDLRNALNAILAGKPVPEPQHAAVGKEVPVLPPPPPRTFGMNAIIAIGPVFFIAGLVIPLINGCRGGKAVTSVWMGWWLLVLGVLFSELMGPALLSHFYGAKAMDDLLSESAEDRGPAVFGYMVTGWLLALIFHAIGFVIRFIFDVMRGLFSKRLSDSHPLNP